MSIRLEMNFVIAEFLPVICFFVTVILSESLCATASTTNSLHKNVYSDESQLLEQLNKFPDFSETNSPKVLARIMDVHTRIPDCNSGCYPNINNGKCRCATVNFDYTSDSLIDSVSTSDNQNNVVKVDSALVSSEIDDDDEQLITTKTSSEPDTVERLTVFNQQSLEDIGQNQTMSMMTAGLSSIANHHSKIICFNAVAIVIFLFQ